MDRKKSKKLIELNSKQSQTSEVKFKLSKMKNPHSLTELSFRERYEENPKREKFDGARESESIWRSETTVGGGERREEI